MVIKTDFWQKMSGADLCTHTNCNERVERATDFLIQMTKLKRICHYSGSKLDYEWRVMPIRAGYLAQQCTRGRGHLAWPVSRPEDPGKRKKTHCGNATVEYTVIAALLILVSVGAWQLLNKNLNSAMAGVQQDM
jgi:Flp pilus assembly pilin Flp